MRYLLIAAAAALIAAPAQSQTMPEKPPVKNAPTTPSTTMAKPKMTMNKTMSKKSTRRAAMAPTASQCKAGYKRSYRKSMGWTRTKFSSACKAMMANMKSKKKMSKPAMMKPKSM